MKQGPKIKNRKKQWYLLLGITLVAALVVLIVYLFNKPGQQVSSLPERLEYQMTYQVINAYPHDPKAFTQGLIFLDGYVFESTGQYGVSSLRKIVLESGEVLQQLDLLPEYFAEGLTAWEDSLVQLTWRERTGFVYDRQDFTLIDRFSYPTEGWGITHDGQRLILSDGTSRLYFLSPETYQVLHYVIVKNEGAEIQHLNELEYIRGEVFANIWRTDYIVRINPDTGQVLGWIDLGGILPPEARKDDTSVLNGIAYDPGNDRLFITGKRWPFLYEIRLIPLIAED